MSMLANVKVAFAALSTGAVSVVSLAAVTLTGIAVINGFKDTSLVDNTTAEKFVTGLGVFATFVGVIVIALVGIVIIMMFRKADMGTD